MAQELRLQQHPAIAAGGVIIPSVSEGGARNATVPAELMLTSSVRSVQVRTWRDERCLFIALCFIASLAGLTSPL